MVGDTSRVCACPHLKIRWLKSVIGAIANFANTFNKPQPILETLRFVRNRGREVFVVGNSYSFEIHIHTPLHSVYDLWVPVLPEPGVLCDFNRLALP